MKKTIILILSAALLALSAVSCGSKDTTIFEGAGDIGDVKIPGSWSYDSSSDTYTLNAAGLNLWETTDAFYMVWKKVSGDFEISGDIAFEGEGVNPHRKLGFIIRESLDADSPYADIAIHGEGLTSLQYRISKGNITEESVSESWGPTTISLARSGDRISVRTGNGSLPDTDDTSISIDLPQECYVGLFLCSHEDDVSETGYFKNVKLIER